MNLKGRIKIIILFLRTKHVWATKTDVPTCFTGTVVLHEHGSSSHELPVHSILL